jgi:EpsI family protein
MPVGDTPMEAQVVQALRLDDYILRTYSRGEASATLYVGYYLSGGKVGAAHDPMVCFPGQGWTVRDTGEARHAMRGGLTPISYSRMVVDREQQQVLVVYWFQSYDQTSAGTFMQKVRTLWLKLRDRREESAFVRVTVPIQRGDRAAAERVAREFIDAFYPPFLAYVQS